MAAHPPPPSVVAALVLLASSLAAPLGAAAQPSLAAGDDHTCALTAAGGVQCWGDNLRGQLGDGSHTSSGVPLPVVGLGFGVAAIAAGSEHTCALTSGGAALCWGSNQFGQLGDGTTASSNRPVPVAGLSGGVAAISAGRAHTCALTTGGGVQCWGWNQFGQLGNGTTASSSVPVAVTGLSGGVAGIAGGGWHTCALTSGGGVQCWGRNLYGQLGDGTTQPSSAPVGVTGLASGVAAIGAGGYHSCALTSGGALQCWGANLLGQLGDGSTASSSVPVAVAGFSGGAAAVAGGDEHTCALTTGGGVQCWGRNDLGQLGDGTVAQSNVPVSVTGLAAGVATIAAGHGHACALASGGVQCWGGNAGGQLGDGTAGAGGPPVPVVGLASGAAAVAAGGDHSCALELGGGAWCWGRNHFGQLGDGSTAPSSVPVAVSGFSGGVAIATGSDHTCAVGGAGAAACWGANYEGQLGDGGSAPSSVPVAVSGLASGVAAIAAGGQHTCALTAAGGVQCWGDNFYGQLGDGTTTSSSVPVPVTGLSSGVAAIAAGYAHTCALTVGGGVQCWGLNAAGQLGDGGMADSSVPVAVTGLGSGVAAIAAGVLHSCALTSGGGVQCWGANSDGELGDGSTLQSSVPVAVTGLGSGVAAIAAGGSHSCALATGGGVLCWGENLHGELGDGSRADRSVPVPVVDLASGVAALAANGEHTCALTTGGGALCWGDNLYGQLGDGHLTHSSVPIAVVGFPAPVPALGAPGLALLAAALLGAAVAVQRRRRLRCALPRATPSAARAD